MKIRNDIFYKLLLMAEALVLVLVLGVTGLSAAGVTHIGSIGNDEVTVDVDTAGGNYNSAVYNTIQADDGTMMREAEDETEAVGGEPSFDVRAALSTMTVEQKVAQLLLTTPEDLTGYRSVTSAGDTTRQHLTELPVGSLAYTVDNYEDPEQALALLTNTRDYAIEVDGVPTYLLIVAADGTVSAYLDPAQAAEAMQAAAEAQTERQAASYDVITPQEGSIYQTISTMGAEIVQVDGVNLVHCTASVQDVYNSILGAIQSGAISEDDLDVAVWTVLAAKAYT